MSQFVSGHLREGISRGLTRVFHGLVFSGLWLSSVQAAVSVDIRTSGALSTQVDQVSYVAAISECTDLTSIDIQAGAFQQSYLPSETTRVDNSALACQLPFTASGTGHLHPQVTLHFRDTSIQTHNETFQYDTNLPDLTFNNISMTLIDGTQYLVTQVDATDDTDISTISFSVTGIRASDLRSVGGVVEKARQNAFATTDGVVNVYPERENQGSYFLSIPVTRLLDAATIAHDGVVLLDITAVDASGNQRSLSKITFTGNDVVEEATGIQAIPGKIIFTNLLEAATIIPSVQFQFRGLTALPGAGTGVTYTSSHPDLISVTPSGLVYPLQATVGQAVTIQVGFPGLPPINIPVTVDLTKTLMREIA